MSLNYNYYEDRAIYKNPVVGAYLDYLDSIVNFQDLWGICLYLHKRDFYWFVPGDDNRECDGRQLRINFERSTSFDNYDVIDQGPASCLEVLIGIAIRMSEECWDPNRSDTSPSIMFHKLMDNLGLTKYRDDVRSMQEEIHRSSEIVDRWLDRSYESDGTGGLFPMKNPYGDLRESEIWYQMHGWLHENYPFL